jgi:hypothetical protein
MFNISKFLTNGLKNTILFKNNSGMSHNGPWKTLQGPTLLDRWHVGDFSSVEYSVSAEYDHLNREICKILVTGTINDAKIVVYSRCSTNIELINVSATVNSSYIDIYVEPKIPKLNGTKVIYTGTYFEAQQSLVS